MATQAAARQPVSSAPGAKLKILRIGIIQGGRIVEERLVRKRENISIEQAASQWSAGFEYLLDLGDEARRLARQLL